MAYEHNGELILTAEETSMLLHNMLHPNPETLQLRDNFLNGLESLEINTATGEMCIDCPEIQMPVFHTEDEQTIYDEQDLCNHGIANGVISYERSDGMGLINAVLFTDQSTFNYSAPQEDCFLPYSRNNNYPTAA